MNQTLVSLFIAATLVTSASADKTTTKLINFEAGKSEAIVSGSFKGGNDVLYKLNARDGQFLQVKMLTDGGADFNIFIPGKAPGDEALYVSAMATSTYLGQLYKNGTHSILIYQNRASARRGKTVHYKMLVSITDKKPQEQQVNNEEVPATGPVPQKVINDCLASLRKQIPNRKMKVVSSKRGENSYIIDVKVSDVPNLWRCFHDGTKCTGTEYQGEG